MGIEIFNKPSVKEKRKTLRNDMTKTEKILWQHLKGEQLGVKFRRQHSIGEYIADFYCPELKLVIEIDGDTHFTDDAIVYDKIRGNFFNSLEINVIRFTNEDVFKNIEGVIFSISETIAPSKSPPNRGDFFDF